MSMEDKLRRYRIEQETKQGMNQCLTLSRPLIGQNGLASISQRTFYPGNKKIKFSTFVFYSVSFIAMYDKHKKYT